MSRNHALESEPCFSCQYVSDGKEIIMLMHQETQWELQMDDMVNKNIKYTFDIYDLTDNVVNSIAAGVKYRMVFQIENLGTEVHFEKVNARLVELDHNSPIKFYSDKTCANQVPRISLDFANLGGAGSGLDSQKKDVFFEATRNVTRVPYNGSITTPLFSIGIYGIVRPEGHSWTTARM
jgi:hypothetical protein